MMDLFKNFIDLKEENEDILAEIPNNFGMELNFSGVKENDIFSMGVHYHDSDNENFNIEAKGKNSEELINNLIINFSKATFLNNRNQENKEHEAYYKLFEDYSELEKDYNEMFQEYEELENEYQRLANDYKKMFAIYEKIQDVLKLENF